MTQSARVNTETCRCCGKRVNEGASRQCPLCKRKYHRKCYLRDCGTADTDGAPCACCLCPELPKETQCEVNKRSCFVDEFLRNGFCVISLPDEMGGESVTDILQRWNAQAKTIFHGFTHAYECQAMAGRRTVPSLDSGFSNFRQRGEGRFEMMSEEISQNAISLVENCVTLQETLCALLSSGRKRMSSGCFYSLHGSKHQNFHTDGPALSDVADMYPYAINVFIPLVPMSSKNGTEFIPGSQRITALEPTKERRQKVRPTVPLGSALLFDYRVIHRGLANMTTSPRPCYYVTYSRDWYTDKYNFSEQRYKHRLEVQPTFLESREERSRRRLEAKSSFAGDATDSRK